jgi:preprotein translocase subunit YajC
VSVIDIVAMLSVAAVLYFLLWRPQMQERKNTEQMLSSLVKDDRVVTIGGLHGRVVEVGPSTVILELGEKTRATFEKTAVAKKLAAAATA